MVDLNEQSLTDMMSRLKTQQEPIRLKPRNMFVPHDTVQQVADKHGISFEEAKLALEAYAQRLMETTK